MRRVVIESPFAGDVERNIAYARLCMRDCILRGEAPYASHLLFTQTNILNDHVEEERELGMVLAREWMGAAQLCAVYADFGISSGMKHGIAFFKSMDIPVEERLLSCEQMMRLGNIMEDQNGTAARA